MEFIETPVITGEFKPKFYWTGNPFEDAKRINNPHIKKEGLNEDRIQDSLNIMNTLDHLNEFTLDDAINIQNRLLSFNNWKGIKSGIRNHDVKIFKGDGSTEPTPSHTEVESLITKLFPVQAMSKENLLEWYKQVQLVHPLSDLNGRVFGIIVSMLYAKHLRK